MKPLINNPIFKKNPALLVAQKCNFLPLYYDRPTTIIQTIQLTEGVRGKLNKIIISV